MLLLVNNYYYDRKKDTLKRGDSPTVFDKCTTDQKLFFKTGKEFVVTHRFVNYNGIEF